MAGGKKYGIYVKPNASMVQVQKAVNKINNQVGRDVARVVSKRSRADAILRLGRISGTNAGVTISGAKDRIVLDRKYVRDFSGDVVGRKWITRLAAHEVGHGLGLEHKKAARNLMNPTGAPYKRLTSKQEAKIRKTKRAGGYK